uniref:G_PROTEIN_RECEP_F1_2 domain-containing protein n=1 Tax=Elaeophora elaphi TaxID=1147741 RepID=A0A0R3S6Z7_9BILA
LLIICGNSSFRNRLLLGSEAEFYTDLRRLFTSTEVLPGICELIELIYVNNSRMRNVFIVEFLSSILAICTTLLALLAIIFNKTLHFNMRLLLLCFWGAIIITCIGTLIDSSYYLIAIVSKIDVERCAWLSFTKSDCIALRNVYYLGLVMFVIATLFLAIERAIATLLYQTYERSSRKWISILMALTQASYFSMLLWLLVIPLMYYQNHSEEHIFPYCAYELFNPKLIANIQLGVIAIQICSFVIIIVLWTHNNKKFLYRKSQNENVSVRYQLRENVSTSKLLVPLVTIITVLVLTSALLHVLLPSEQTDNYRIIVDQLITYCFYAEIQACFLPIASIILAIILCHTSKAIRSTLFHLLGLECCMEFGRRNSVNVSPEEFIRQSYFDQLHQQWNDLPISWNGTMCNGLEYKTFPNANPQQIQ